jgi:hypothetical protein
VTDASRGLEALKHSESDRRLLHSQSSKSGSEKLPQDAEHSADEEVQREERQEHHKEGQRQQNFQVILFTFFLLRGNCILQSIFISPIL